MTERRTATDGPDFFDGQALPEGGAVGAAAFSDELTRLGRALSPTIFLGASSWAFPGWTGIVYDSAYTESQLARAGLAAYARHPLLRTVGIEHGAHGFLAASDYQHYARQVPDGFRFVAKAPAAVTDPVLRAAHGSADAPNPDFLDASLASDRFVRPALAGFGPHAGPLVFQFDPLPRAAVQDPQTLHALIDRIGSFIAALPKEIGGMVPIYAVEVRNAELLTPRLVRMLREVGARLCLSLHAHMPEAARQSAALRAMDGLPEEGDQWLLKGPLVVRWNRHSGRQHDNAPRRYAPFDRIMDADILARGTLAHLIHVAMRSKQAAFVLVNNQAEGCAPASCIELARAVIAR
jgi:uncharacterized protein YecE (DUF72 family)